MDLIGIAQLVCGIGTICSGIGILWLEKRWDRGR